MVLEAFTPRSITLGNPKNFSFHGSVASLDAGCLKWLITLSTVLNSTMTNPKTQYLLSNKKPPYKGGAPDPKFLVNAGEVVSEISRSGDRSLELTRSLLRHSCDLPRSPWLPIVAMAHELSTFPKTTFKAYCQ